MKPAVFLCHRYSLDPVDSGFMLKCTEGIPAFYFYCQVTDLIGLPVSGNSEFKIHAQQVSRPDFGLITAGSRADFDDSSISLHRIEFYLGLLGEHLPKS